MLSPTVAGVFAHESFGHKSESDFMLGSETMRREWELGKQVGWEGLSILDSGVPNGSGYCPYDDEGTRARDTYLVKNGVLTGRLHSAATAAALDEAGYGQRPRHQLRVRADRAHDFHLDRGRHGHV